MVVGFSSSLIILKLSFCISFHIGGYDVEKLKIRAEAHGGQHFRSSRLTLFRSKQRQAPVHTAPTGFCFITVFTLMTCALML
jgi:hypothetical protein